MKDKVLTKVDIVMSICRKIVLVAYAVTVFIVGVFYVPVRLMWDKAEVSGLKYVNIKDLVSHNMQANGFTVRYELCTSRAIYQIAIITIIAVALYFAFSEITSLKKIKK